MTMILNNHVLAADVGGTNTRMAIVTGNGEILTFLKKSTHCKEGRDEMIKFLVSFARETIEKSKLPKEKICGMGIGFPGPLNAETGTIFNPPNLNGWDNVPLRDILEKELRVPVSIENDANAAALGEWEVADISERKVTLRCPISKKKFTWDLFCYFVEERDNSPWPME